MSAIVGLFVYVESETKVPTQVQVRDAAGNEFPLSVARYADIGCQPVIGMLPSRSVYQAAEACDSSARAVPELLAAD